MTNPRISPAGISALAALVHEVRPDWDRRGVAAVLHKLADAIPAADLGIAALRAASDRANETPEAFAHLNNRAWDSDWWTPCKIHPDTRARTPAGECGNCRSDRIGTDGEPQPLRRRGVGPTPDARAQLVAAIGAVSVPPTASEPTQQQASQPIPNNEAEVAGG